MELSIKTRECNDSSSNTPYWYTMTTFTNNKCEYLALFATIPAKLVDFCVRNGTQKGGKDGLQNITRALVWLAIFEFSFYRHSWSGRCFLRKVKYEKGIRSVRACIYARLEIIIAALAFAHIAKTGRRRECTRV